MGSGGIRARVSAIVVPAAVLAPLILPLLAIALIVRGSPTPVHAAILCVKPGGGDGCRAAIAEALTLAQAGDAIRVATGTYTESLEITQTISLEGGWDAGFTVRDPAANPTTLRPADPTLSVIRIRGNFSDPTAVTPTVDGFTITGGRADLGGNHGGGIQIRDSDARIRNNVITGNVAFLLGGGVWVQRGAPILTGNRIEGNRSDGLGQFALGGGVELENTRATLSDNYIAHNVVSGTRANGGGVEVNGGGLVALANNTIFSNTARISGINVARGGGLAAQNVTLTLSGDAIRGNMTDGYSAEGGGIYVHSGRFTLTNVTVADNANSVATTSGGGGIYAGYGRLAVTGGTVRGNRASVGARGYGGGIQTNLVDLSLTAVRVQDNQAGPLDVPETGNGIELIGSPFTLTNVLLTGNTGAGAVGIQADAASRGLVVNSTLADNELAGLRTGSALTLTNSLVLRHTTGISLTSATAPVSQTHNAFWDNMTHAAGFNLSGVYLVVDPRLDDNYRLGADSPLIDAGTRAGAPPADLDGEPRPSIGSSGLYRVDIGADERSGPSQRRINLLMDPADLTVIGPGGPKENPDAGGPNDWIGYAVLGADINGDGRADLLTAAQDWAEDFNNPPLATGRLFGLSPAGSRLTGTIDLLTDTASLTVVNRYLLSHIGEDLIGADVTGDRVRDLIFSSTSDDNAGNGAVTPTVFLLRGGTSLTGTRVLSDVSPPDYRLRAPGQDFFGYGIKNALAAADLSGDGVADLIVADYLANDGGLAKAGAVFVQFGGPALSGTHDLATTPADYTLYGPAANAELGYAAAGRVDSDSAFDLVARTELTAYVRLGPIAAGTSRLSATPADVTITGLTFGGVEVLDLTGDGRDDLLLGSSGNLHVVPGPLAAGDSFDVRARSIVTLTGVSASSLVTGQVAGDPRPDLIAVSQFSGQTFVIAAGQNLSGTLPVEEVAATILSGGARDAAAGDLDADGRPDLIVGLFGVGVNNHPDDYEDAGKTFVFYSGSDVETEPTSTPTAAPGTGTPTPSATARATQPPTATTVGQTPTAASPTATASTLPGTTATPEKQVSYFPIAGRGGTVGW